MIQEDGSTPRRFEMRWDRGSNHSGSTVSGDAPGPWGDALRAVGHDLALGQYNKRIDWLNWVVEVDDGTRSREGDVVLYVDGPGQLNLGIGMGMRVDSPLPEVICSAVGITQDALGDYDLAWPHKDAGGLLYVRNVDGEAAWVDPPTSPAAVAPVGALLPQHLAPSQ